MFPLRGGSNEDVCGKLLLLRGCDWRLFLRNIYDGISLWLEMNIDALYCWILKWRVVVFEDSIR